MNRGQEDLAVAMWVERKHNSDGPAYIAEQIGRLVLDGDEQGVLRWKAIARQYQALMNGAVQ